MQLRTARCRSWAFSDTSHTYRCCRDGEECCRADLAPARLRPAHRARTPPTEPEPHPLRSLPTSVQATPPQQAQPALR